MPWGAAAAAAATIGGAMITADASKKAANTQANAARDQQNQLLGIGREAAQKYNPYMNVGESAMRDMLSNNTYFNHQFNSQDLNAGLAPNYAWSLQQGQAANKAASNATGGMVGGNALSALNQFSQNYAQNAYQQAFQNYQNQRNNIYNINSGESQLGLAGTTGYGNTMLGTGTNVAQLGIGAANAQAAGAIGQANAYSSGLNSLGGLAYSYGKGNPSNGGGGGGGGYTQQVYDAEGIPLTSSGGYGFGD